MSDKEKIIVKINGDRKEFTERTEQYNEDVLLENETVEHNVIDFQKKQKEREHRSFWDDGNREKAPKLPFYKRKKKRSSKRRGKFPLSVAIAVVSAILIGLALGMMLLTLFGRGEEQISTNDFETNPEIIDVFSAHDSTSVFLIQVGAFSNLDKGKEMAQVVRSKGFASFLHEQVEPKLLFAAVAAERGQAEKLRERLEASGLETFIKTAEVTSEDDDFFKLYVSALQLVVRALTEGSVAPSDVVSLEEQISEQNSSEEKIAQLKVVSSLLQRFLTGNDDETLWQAQEKLLQLLWGQF